MNVKKIALYVREGGGVARKDSGPRRNGERRGACDVLAARKCVHTTYVPRRCATAPAEPSDTVYPFGRRSSRPGRHDFRSSTPARRARLSNGKRRQLTVVDNRPRRCNNYHCCCLLFNVTNVIVTIIKRVPSISLITITITIVNHCYHYCYHRGCY